MAETTAVRYPDSFWRSLRHLNGFRLYLAVFFIASALFADRLSWLARDSLGVFLTLSLAYAATTWSIGGMIRRRQPDFERQLIGQLLLDIGMIVILMHLGGGKDTGLALLLMVYMAAAGLHASTRVMLLIPAAATLALLLEQGMSSWSGPSGLQGFFQAGVLAVGLFMVASLAHVLARGTLAAAALAGAKEREVASLEKINARVIQDLPYGVLVVDGDNRLLQANGQASAWLECRMAPHVELRACCAPLAGLLDAWKRREPRLDGLFKNPGGRHYRARLIELDPERRDGAVIILEDLSELEQEAQKLKLAALGRLTANLAHEIRNPLSAVRHAAQLLAEDVPSEGTAGRLTRIIEDNVGRLNRMVEDVLLLNRRDRLAREAIPVAAYLDDFLAQFQEGEHLPEGLIEIEVEAGSNVSFDRTHLHQILWNLLRNALRHCSRTPGSIHVGARASGARCLIEVYNDGAPIPAELVARLFEPFYTTDSRGTGLGLHIARELAEANHAELSCLTRDEGALFRLTCDCIAP
jgi:two-component system sensor histidine kinase PilS (NtrC family)